jgi:hypothetical protein
VAGVRENLELQAEPKRRLAQRRPDAREAPPAGAFGGVQRLDVSSLARARDYQGEIERASALLFKVQPDLVAGENVAIKEAEPARARWPFIVALGAALLFWVGLAWATVSAI